MTLCTKLMVALLMSTIGYAGLDKEEQATPSSPIQTIPLVANLNPHEDLTEQSDSLVPDLLPVNQSFKPNRSLFLMDLPPELLIKVFRVLGIKDLYNMALVCKEAHEISSHVVCLLPVWRISGSPVFQNPPFPAGNIVS